jgi:hypothetical protein
MKRSLTLAVFVLALGSTHTIAAQTAPAPTTMAVRVTDP